MIDEFKGGLFFAALSLIFYYIKTISLRTRALEYELKKLKRNLTDSLETDLRNSVDKSPLPDQAGTAAKESLQSLIDEPEVSPHDLPEIKLSEPVIDGIIEKEAMGAPSSIEPVAVMNKDDGIKNAWIEESPEPEKITANIDGFNNIIAQIKNFFIQGNVVVKVGVIILFFGVGFLLKYASEHNMLPIELRLSFAAIAGIVLLV